MSYLITRSDGSTLTTIDDGTLDTSSSLSLPGRNFDNYGFYENTNAVKKLENFAGPNPPKFPIKGQLWFNTTDQSVRYCPADGITEVAEWKILASTNNGGSTELGNIQVTGEISTSNVSANAIFSNVAQFNSVAISGNLSGIQANFANLYTEKTNVVNITTGSRTTSGNLSGPWTVKKSLNISNISGGNPHVTIDNTGMSSDSYRVWNPVTNAYESYVPYKNANVFEYLTSTTSGSRFNGNLTISNLAATGSISTTANLSILGNASFSSLTVSTLDGIANINSANASLTTMTTSALATPNAIISTFRSTTSNISNLATTLVTIGNADITSNLAVTNVGANMKVTGNKVSTINLTITGVSDLGSVTNVKISGGTAGQVLTKKADGTLEWATPLPKSNDGLNLSTLIPAIFANVACTDFKSALDRCGLDIDEPPVQPPPPPPGPRDCWVYNSSGCTFAAGCVVAGPVTTYNTLAECQSANPSTPVATGTPQIMPAYGSASGTVNSPVNVIDYDYTNFTGATPTYSIAPALPAGMSLNASTGVISGTPTTVQTQKTYVVTCSNGTQTAIANYYLEVTAVQTAMISPASQTISGSKVGVAINPTTVFTATGFDGPVTYSWNLSSSSGLTINPNTGVASGTPAPVTELAAYTVIVTATSGGKTATATILISTIAQADKPPAADCWNHPYYWGIGQPCFLIPGCAINNPNLIPIMPTTEQECQALYSSYLTDSTSAGV